MYIYKNMLYRVSPDKLGNIHIIICLCKRKHGIFRMTPRFSNLQPHLITISMYQVGPNYNIHVRT